MSQHETAPMKIEEMSVVCVKRRMCVSVKDGAACRGRICGGGVSPSLASRGRCFPGSEFGDGDHADAFS